MATTEQLYPLVYPSGTADGERSFVLSALHRRVVWPEIWSCLSCARTGLVRKLGHTLPLNWWRCRGEFGCWIWICVCYWWREMKDDPKTSTQCVYWDLRSVLVIALSSGGFEYLNRALTQTAAGSCSQQHQGLTDNALLCYTAMHLPAFLFQPPSPPTHQEDGLWTVYKCFHSMGGMLFS